MQACVNKFDTTRRGLDFPTFLYLCSHLAQIRSIFEVLLLLAAFDLTSGMTHKTQAESLLPTTLCATLEQIFCNAVTTPCN